MKRATALIAGAGIGGLAAGIALRRVGFEVHVLERTRELREVGAALLIWPNGTRALQALGVEARTLKVKKESMRTWRGRHLFDAPVESLFARHGSDMAFVHRADLQAGLLRAFGAGAVRLNAEVTGFVDRERRIEAILKGGERVEGDLLIGADGLRSAVRWQLLDDGDPSYLGATIWRGIAAAGGIPLEPGHGVNWVGRGAEFLAFHLADNRIYWAGVTKEPQGAAPGPGGHREDLTARFGSWEEPVPQLIAATDEAAILRNDMYDRRPAGRWSRGRVTLLGDAAHPMTPNAGQGACQALEDAVALGECLSTTSDPALAFAHYEARRLKRANRIVGLSHQISRAVQFENPLLCALRDGWARLMPESIQLRMMDVVVASTPSGSSA